MQRSLHLQKIAWGDQFWPGGRGRDVRERSRKGGGSHWGVDRIEGDQQVAGAIIAWGGQPILWCLLAVFLAAAFGAFLDGRGNEGDLSGA